MNKYDQEEANEAYLKSPEYKAKLEKKKNEQIEKEMANTEEL